MKKLLLWVAGGLISLILVTLILLISMDLGRFKNTITSFASDYLGRELGIEGDLSIRVGDSLAISASDIYLRSTDWTEEPDLLRIGSLDVSVDTLSLLSDLIVIEAVLVDGTQLSLSQDESGQDNYSLPGLESTDDSSPASTSPDILLTRVEVTNTRIQFQSPALNPALTFTADSLSIEQTADEHLAIILAGSLNETPVNANGSFGTMADLIAASNVTFDLTASVGEIDMSGTGHIDDLTSPRLPTASLTVHGPSAEYLTDVLDLDPVTSGPMDLELNLLPGADGLRATAHGVYGEFKVNLEGRVADLQNLDDGGLTADAAGPSLATLGRLAQQPGLPEVPFTVDIEAAKSGDQLTVDHLNFRTGQTHLYASATLPVFPSIAGGVAELRLEGPEFAEFNWLPGLPGRLTGPFSVVGSLEQTDTVGLLEANLVSDAFHVELTARVSEEEDLTGSQISISVSDDDVTTLAEALEIDGLPASSFASVINADIGRESIQLTESNLTFGSDLVEFSGTVGREPISDLTRLQAQSSFEDLAATLRAFGIEPPELPFNSLQLKTSYSHNQERSRVNGNITLPAGTAVTIDAEIADSMDPESAWVRTKVDAEDLSTLLPPELKSELKSELRLQGPFTAAALVRIEAEQVLIEEGQVDFQGARATMALTTPMKTPFESGSAQIEMDAPGIFKIASRANEYLSEDQPVEVTGKAEWTTAQITLDQIGLQFGKARANLNGVLSRLPDAGDHELQISLDLDSLQDLQYLSERPLPDEPFSLQGTLQGDPSEMKASLTKLVLGPTSATARATYQPAGPEGTRPNLDVHVRSALIDLRPLASMFKSDEASEPAPVPDDGRVIPDFALPIEQLRLMDIRIDFFADRFLTPELDLTNTTLLAEIEDGALDIDQFGLTGIMGTMSGAMEAMPSEQGIDLKLAVNGTDLTVGLPAATEDAFDRLPRYTLEILLNSSGRTIREHAASLTGYVKGVSGAGEVDLAALRLFTRDFAGEVLDTVNPFVKKEPLSQVQCTGLLVELDDGILFGDPILLFQTDKLNIAAVARADLGTEKVNATISTRARKGLGISVSDIVSPYTEIGGTLAAPRLQLNSKSAILSGSTTIATMGISFLAKKAHERFIADQNPCQTAIRIAEEALKAREFAVPPS